MSIPEKNLEQYLKENYEKDIIDFSIRTMVGANGMIQFYIHPTARDGETFDYFVDQNKLIQKRG